VLINNSKDGHFETESPELEYGAVRIKVGASCVYHTFAVQEALLNLEVNLRVRSHA
jgi:hypothetical protein